MTDPRGDRNGPRSIAPAAPSSVGVLADRIAAALIHHEPGWRLPRLTALARRYNVSTAEVDAAIDELAARHLLRRLPDGQVYRASPAEYQVPLAGLAALSSRVDPMGGDLTCRNRQVSTRRVPEETGRALGLAPGEKVLVIRCLWAVSGEPGALSATYLPERLAGLADGFGMSLLAGLGSPAAGGAACEPVPGPHGPGNGGNGETAREPEPVRVPAQPLPRPAWKGAGSFSDAPPAGLPRAVQVEFGPPPPSVARSLRLAAGQSVASVTVRFEDPAALTPVALTTAMLRPDLFRIVVQAPDPGERADGSAGWAAAWTRAAESWEP